MLFTLYEVPTQRPGQNNGSYVPYSLQQQQQDFMSPQY